MAGAGISVSANLPDFRSKGGLYDQLRQTTNITSPETIFTRDFLKSNPELFFEVMQKLRVDHVMPTLTHFFLRLLQDKGLLRRLYTQNIDSLERKAGIREELLIECHGTTATSKCHECQQAYSKDHYFDWDRTNGVPRCERCSGLTRPDIVLFGEALPDKFQEKSREELRKAPARAWRLSSEH
ncbi:sirt2 [Symbiodinium pilosum]|uniref:Sirt2 protein n=1 Tax=Symbiodinium pilosum TaxID=2952 RepID=A0A812XTH8_SYMPI|nr:sirt2 [Symbiodinium pilosum]